MIYTNRLGLPESYVRAVEKAGKYSHDGDIGVTSLISPPRVFQLRKRHAEKLTADVSEWNVQMAFEGTALHEALAAGAGPQDIVKKRFYVERAGWKVTGEPDLLEPDGKLTDWKRTSVWSVILGGKKEWEQQLNLYGLLLRENKLEVKEGQVVAFLRDWSAAAAKRDPAQYPQESPLKVSIKMHTPEVQERLLEHRLKVHQEAAGLADDALPECTAEERWEKPATWAVMPEGRKRSKANYTIPKHGEDAEAQAEERARQEGGVVQYRPGESVRCANYCPVRHICPVGQAAMRAKAGGGEE